MRLRVFAFLLPVAACVWLGALSVRSEAHAEEACRVDIRTQGMTVRAAAEAFARATGATLDWSSRANGDAPAPASLRGACRDALSRLLSAHNAVTVIGDTPETDGRIERIFVLGDAVADAGGTAVAPTQMASGAPGAARPADSKDKAATGAHSTLSSSAYLARVERELAWSINGQQALSLAGERRALAAGGGAHATPNMSAGYPRLYSERNVAPARQVEHRTVAITQQMAIRDLSALASALRKVEPSPQPAPAVSTPPQ